MLSALFGFNDDELKSLKTKLDEQNNLIYQQTKLIQKQNDTIDDLQTENTKLKLSLDNYKLNKKNIVFICNYLNENYNNANILDLVDYYSITYEQKKSKLHIYIGDFIVKSYKKHDQCEQSIWYNEPNYLIRELDVDNKLVWKIDKKGIRMTEIIINPLVEHMKDNIANYISTNFKRISTISGGYTSDMLLSKNAEALIEMKYIENKILHKKIFNYIKPYFLFNIN